MKFCYIDESGHLGEITVVVGILVDAMRMHTTKGNWESLLQELDNISEGRLVEIKGRELYRGNGSWRDWDGEDRNALIDSIIDWMTRRKHRVVFSAVAKSRLANLGDGLVPDPFCTVTVWSLAALHLMLGIQKANQGLSNNKGKTLFVFDEVRERGELLALINDPPPATHGFYGLKKRRRPLDQVIDVPYFTDSRYVGLIQVADLFAYILHLYAELKEGIATEKFSGELDCVEEWVSRMQPVLLPDSARWPQGSSDSFTRFIRNVAPPSLLRVAP